MPKKIDPNLLIAMGVLIASFGALFVYIRQASIMNEQTEILLEQTKASTWPYLTMGLSRNFVERELDNLRINVVNKGVGPAIVKYVILYYKEDPVQNWNEFYTKLNFEKGTSFTHNNQRIHDAVISANDGVELIEWSEKKTLSLVSTKTQDITIEICYQSIHGDA